MLTVRSMIRIILRNATLPTYADLADFLAAHDKVKIIESKDGTSHKVRPSVNNDESARDTHPKGSGE